MAVYFLYHRTSAADRFDMYVKYVKYEDGRSEVCLYVADGSDRCSQVDGLFLHAAGPQLARPLVTGGRQTQGRGRGTQTGNWSPTCRSTETSRHGINHLHLLTAQ